MSLFRDSMDRRADEAISTKPSVQTGYMKETAAFVQELKAEPLFKTFNQMSAIDLARLEKDTIENGLSVGVKDTSGVSRKEIVHCNPKLSNQSIIGSESAKVPVMDSSKGFAQIDLIFSGTNNQLPTINGFQVVKRTISDKTQTTAADTAANTPAQGEQTGQIAQTGQATTPTNQPATPNSNAGSNSGFGSQNEGANRINSSSKNVVKDDSAVPKLLDNKGKPTNNKDTTQRGPYANSIRTGTLKVTNFDLSNMVKLSTPTMDAILGINLP
jgi:hypothetical protein